MQELYNCKTENGEYRITKFDSDLNPINHKSGPSSYLVSLNGCECPQGHKASCRHRKMLEIFESEEHINDGYFFIWNTHQWIKPTGIFANEEIQPLHVTPDPFLEGDEAPELPASPPAASASAPPSAQPSPRPYRRY